MRLFLRCKMGCNEVKLEVISSKYLHSKPIAQRIKASDYRFVHVLALKTKYAYF